MECDLLMIKIEKVINKNDLKAFIAFPSSLYPDDPNWIPPLFIERNEHLSAKNPGTDHIIWQAWVAKKAGQIVGRITAQIDTLHRERYGEDTGHFGMIDAIDDPQVFAALFGAAEAWLKSQGASKISGPFSLNINQESGLLMFGVGAAITVVPMLVAVIVGRLVFKINILDLLGTITGGMTSTPGLAAADSMVDSNIPSVAYATVYPIAMVFLILFIQVISSAVY